MLGLKMPKTVVWIAMVALVFLLLMTGYRIFILWLFIKDTAPVSDTALLFAGTRFDSRYVAFISLIVLIIGLIPGMHLFKSHAGKNLALGILTVFAALLLLLYGLDIVSLINTSERLNTSFISQLFGNTSLSKTYRTNAPWAIILLLVGVGTWLFYLFIRLSHRAMGKTKTTDNKTMRAFWQLFFLLGCFICLHGKFSKSPLTAKNVVSPYQNQAAKAVINPAESLLFPSK